MKHILLVCGGDGSEHAISQISAAYLRERLEQHRGHRVISVCLEQGRYTSAEGVEGWFAQQGHFVLGERSLAIAAAVPCFHGQPGETGQFQSPLELLGIPYIGCGAQASLCCFNKITAKLYFRALDIPTAPFIMLSGSTASDLEQAHAAFARWGDVFVKAACQGSSVGCYHVAAEAELEDAITAALGYSQTVLIEQTVHGRELEVAAYEYDGRLHISAPGEILTPSGDSFYSYDQKYAASSETVTTLEPEGLDDTQRARLQELARRAFIGLHLRDLSRIDFFLSASGEILLNEINTFPGMTPISMFPKLLEHEGHDMTAFLVQCLSRAQAAGTGGPRF